MFFVPVRLMGPRIDRLDIKIRRGRNVLVTDCFHSAPTRTTSRHSADIFSRVLLAGPAQWDQMVEVRQVSQGELAGHGLCSCNADRGRRRW